MNHTTFETMRNNLFWAKSTLEACITLKFCVLINEILRKSLKLLQKWLESLHVNPYHWNDLELVVAHWLNGRRINQKAVLRGSRSWSCFLVVSRHLLVQSGSGDGFFLLGPEELDSGLLLFKVPLHFLQLELLVGAVGPDVGFRSSLPLQANPGVFGTWTVNKLKSATFVDPLQWGKLGLETDGFWKAAIRKNTWRHGQFRKIQ